MRSRAGIRPTARGPTRVRSSTRRRSACRGLANEHARFCRANIGSLAARSVTVADVAVEGDRARGRFTADGGAYALRTATVELRRAGGRWRLHRLTALTLDRARFARQQARVARLAEPSVSPRQAACVIERLERVPSGELEAALLRSRAAVLADPLLDCAIGPALRDAGLPTTRTRCVVERLRRDPERLVRRLLARTPTAGRELERTFARAGAACE